MVGNLFTLIIVAIAVGCGMIVAVISITTRAFGRRGANRKELQELKGDISEIKGNIEDIKEQLADIIIRLA